MKLLARVHRALDAKGIGHAVIGAAALAIRGVARSTFDLDVLVRDTACLRSATWKDIRAAGASVEIRRGDADDPLAGVVRLDLEGARPVDVIVGRSAWQTEVIERATPQPLGGVQMPVARASDLVLLKLYAGGVQDRWDIEQLLAAGRRRAIVTGVNREIAKLPARCRQLWREFSS